MIEEQLQAIKDRVEYATKGPWKIVNSEESGVQIGTTWESGQLKACVPIVTTAHGKDGVTVYINKDNAEFIANAREDIPVLIAEFELQKANAEQYLQDNVELHNENLILNNEIQRLSIALDRTELAEVKARIEIEASEGYLTALLKKRVQQLENLLEKHGHLNVFLQQRTVNGWGNHVVDMAMQHIQKQEKEIERLRGALEFYADEENNRHTESFTLGQIGRMSEVAQDEGYLARKALAGESNE